MSTSKWSIIRSEDILVGGCIWTIPRAYLSSSPSQVQNLRTQKIFIPQALLVTIENFCDHFKNQRISDYYIFVLV